MAFGMPRVPYNLKGQKYVFYGRLQEDGYLDLYNKAYNLYDARVIKSTKIESLIKYFDTLSKEELKKETALLKNVFGAAIPDGYLLSSDSGKQLIDAFNYALNVKSVFERNLNLIKGLKNAKIPVDIVNSLCYCMFTK